MTVTEWLSVASASARLPGYSWTVTDGRGWLLAITATREEADDAMEAATGIFGSEAAPLTARAVTYEEWRRVTDESVPLLNPELWRRS